MNEDTDYSRDRDEFYQSVRDEAIERSKMHDGSEDDNYDESWPAPSKHPIKIWVWDHSKEHSCWFPLNSNKMVIEER